MWLCKITFLMRHFKILTSASHSTEVTSFILLFSEVTSAISFEKRNFRNKLVDARNNLIDIHLIQFWKKEFCFQSNQLLLYTVTSDCLTATKNKRKKLHIYLPLLLILSWDMIFFNDFDALVIHYCLDSCSHV